MLSLVLTDVGPGQSLTFKASPVGLVVFFFEKNARPKKEMFFELSFTRRFTSL